MTDQEQILKISGFATKADHVNTICDNSEGGGMIKPVQHQNRILNRYIKLSQVITQLERDPRPDYDQLQGALDAFCAHVEKWITGQVHITFVREVDQAHDLQITAFS